MATVDEALQSQIRNIEQAYGRTMPEWIEIIKASGKAKHAEIMGLLKTEYGMTHGNANRVALIAREADAASMVRKAEEQGSDPIAELYSGAKASLRPLHERLMAVLHALGSEVEIAPKKGYLSIRRKKQFCMIQPSTATRVDVGLILKDTPDTERLELSKSFNAMFTHRVRLSSPEEVDGELTTWLKRAYDQAG